jgi:hypothetical protein
MIELPPAIQIEVVAHEMPKSATPAGAGRLTHVDPPSSVVRITPIGGSEVPASPTATQSWSDAQETEKIDPAPGGTL